MSSDVRSLLRQQRAARRIEHPHAAYSDAGKLLCTLCREQLKAESLWNSHLGSQSHKERLQQQQQQQQQPTASRIESPPPPPGESSNGRAHKRKLDATDAADDVDMGDAAAVRRKRGRPDVISLTGLPLGGDGDSSNSSSNTNGGGGDGKSDALTPEQISSAGSSSNNSKDSIMTPPGLTRKLSVTPSQGIELQIPSRPATPAHARRDGGGPTSSSSGGVFNVQSQNGSSTPVAAAAAAAAAAAFRDASGTTAASTTLKDASSSSSSSSAAAAAAAASAAAHAVDESEWAAFEADIAATTAPYDEKAIISAPAMTNEEAAAAKEAEDAAHAERKLQADMDIEFEREEAKRALEDEFEEMKELEQRVGKLKEMRAAFLNMRTQNAQHEPGLADANRPRGNVLLEKRDDDDEDEDEDDEDEDEWDLFRFRR
ncbi:hypothetical protein E4U54_002542 [Claviceps lovelessii]|nr:hypothetical protein E4U54_002542 [Claviceps lovelessii]